MKAVKWLEAKNALNLLMMEKKDSLFVWVGILLIRQITPSFPKKPSGIIFKTNLNIANASPPICGSHKWMPTNKKSADPNDNNNLKDSCNDDKQKKSTHICPTDKYKKRIVTITTMLMFLITPVFEIVVIL